MTPLTLTITKAGLERFTAAQLDDDLDLAISNVGLTDADFAVAPTLEELPGEFRRIETVSGAQVGDNIVHMTIRDDEAIGYSARGFGLFLADGTLFAVYGQAQPLFEKSPRSALLAAIDIAFPTGDVSDLRFGNTDFLNPPATTDTVGVAELATQAEVDEGADAARIVTPRTLASRLSAMLLPLLSRRIVGGGLATGGGDLSTDRTITVPAATVAEADAGAIATKALTPASIANLLSSLRDKVPLARRVDTAGLARGGGTLAANRTIDVPSATADQVRAGQAADAVMTPATFAALFATFAATGECQIGPGLFLKAGTRSGSFGEGGHRTNFATPFPNACRGVWITGINLSASTLRDIYLQRAALDAAGFVAFVQKAGEDGTTIDGFDWIAIGY